MEPLFLSIDLGTSRCKAALFDARGAVVSVLDHSIETQTPRPGWVEQDPVQWWSAVCTLTRELIAHHGLRRRLAAIAVTGQMHVLVPVDPWGVRTGPAITLMDRRAEGQCRTLESHISQRRLYQITGARLGPYAPLAKMLWLKDNLPGVLGGTRHLLPCKDYLRFLMTGVAATEPVDAAGTLLYDISSSQWSAEICDTAGIPLEMLPSLMPPSQIAGTLTREASIATGLPEGTPVVVGAGDDVAFLAVGVVSPGQAYEDLGSTASFLVCVDHPVEIDDLSLDRYPHVLPDRWLVGGATSTAGAAADWAARVLGDGANEKFNRGRSGLLFLPYLEGARSPRWDSTARGVFFGLTTAHGPSDLHQAVKEGVAFALRDLVESLRLQDIGITEIFSTGGGVRDEGWARVRATLYGQPTLRAEVMHGSCLGAAMLSATALGTYPDLEKAVAGMRSPWEKMEPLEEEADRYERLYLTHKKLFDAVRPLFSEIA